MRDVMRTFHVFHLFSVWILPLATYWFGLWFQLFYYVSVWTLSFRYWIELDFWIAVVLSGSFLWDFNGTFSFTILHSFFYIFRFGRTMLFVLWPNYVYICLYLFISVYNSTSTASPGRIYINAKILKLIKNLKLVLQY